jgi:hypothetical protein
MSFLAPLFLLGALAIAGPVIFHLIRRTTRERTRFSSLLFLQPVPPRLTRRSRIEHWLLLLLRAAALGLLALAFARPWIRTAFLKAENPAAPRRVVVLVDVSASMQRAGLREAALEKAEAALRDARPFDEYAVVTFANATQTLIDFEQWSALPESDRATTAAARLREVAAGWASTNLSAALMNAAEMLTAVPGGGKTQVSGEIMLISDLQEGSRMQGLQGWDWPREVRLTTNGLTPTKPGNAGLHLAADLSGTTAPEEPVARVRVWNAQDSTGEQFQVGWASPDGARFSGPAHDVYVPPGQTRVVTLPWPQGPAVTERLLLRGDTEPFDNAVFTVPSVTARVKAYYFGTEPATDPAQPLFFLHRALPHTRQVAVEIEPVTPGLALPPATPGESAIFFATGALPVSQAEALHSKMLGGATVMLALTRAEAAPALAKLAGVSSVGLGDTKPASYAMLADIDFQHPLFAPFADPRFSDFTKIRFWKYRRFDAAALPQSRVLARFDSGDPALVELPVGPGRLLVLAAGWHPEDSQLALSSKFVPLLSSLLESSGTVVTPPMQHFAGQPIPLAELGLANAGPVTVRHPDGAATAVEPTSGLFHGATAPGIYTATAGGLTRSFAVNPDPAESRTVALSPDELERLGAPVNNASAERETAAASSELAPAVETEGRQKLWRWMIIASLAVLFVETLLAGLTARRALTAGGSTS